MTSSAKRAIRTPADDGWLFEELDTINTPSRADGVSRRTEALVNSSVAAFLTEASKSLQVPQITTLVAMKFFLRFYMVESLRNHRPEQVATACLFLSCKVNETHKRLRDIIYWTVKTRTKHTKDFPDGEDVTDTSERYYEEKNTLLSKERDLLRTLNFDLQVEHPYKYLLDLAKKFLQPAFGVSEETHKTVLQAAFNFLNDAMRTTYVHIMFDEIELATAVFYMGCTLHGVRTPDGTGRDAEGRVIPSPCEVYGAEPERLRKIAVLILKSYSDRGDS